MDDSLTLGKRVSAALVAAVTVLSTVGFAAFAAPTTAKAATAGSLVKGSLAAVYYVGHDGARYTFPNEKTYKTWYSDFSGVTTISDSELADITLAGNVVYRPGSRWIKITSDNKTYAVARNGMIHWIETETVANNYEGADWNTNIDDVPDVFFVDYEVGSSLMAATAFDGMLYQDGGNNYVAWDGEKRLVTSAGMTANRLMAEHFLDGAGIDDSALTSGADISSSICDLSDAAQTGCEDAVVGGDVTVSLATSTPAGATLPTSATSVPVMSFNLKAGSESAEVNQIVVRMAGIGATDNVSNVYLYEGNTRLTEGRTVNSSTRTATFGTLGLDLDPNETRTITVRVDVASGATSGAEVKFEVQSADAVDAGGDVAGTFPVTGNSFSVGTVSVGSVTVAKNGTISNPAIGANDAVIGQFTVAADSENAEIEVITLKIDDADDHGDFKLWTNTGTLLATGTAIGNDLVKFDLSASPFVVAEGLTKTFQVSADIGGEAGDDIKVYLDKDADIVAIGGDYGFGMDVTRTAYDGDSCTPSGGDCSFSKVQGGEVTLSFVGPVAGDIRTNSQDQTLLTFNLTAAQAVTVKDLDIIVYGDDDGDNDPFNATEGGVDSDNTGLIGDGEGHLTDIKLVNADTGAVLSGPFELDLNGNDAAQTIDFTDDFSVKAGETVKIAVRADIDNSVASGTEFGAAVAISGFVASDVNGDNLDNDTDVVPTGNIQGRAQTANAASLTLSLSSTPGDVDAVRGTSNVTVNSFNVVAGTAGEVDVTSVEVSVYSDDDNAGAFAAGDGDVDVNSYVNSCSLYNSAGTLLAGPKAPSADGKTITFTGMSWSLSAGANDRLDVKCNFSSAPTTTGYFAFDIADGDITAQDADGITVNAGGDAANGGTSPVNVVTVATGGTIATSKAATSPVAGILLAGDTGNHVTSIQLLAETEDFTVTTLTLEEDAATELGTTNAYDYMNNFSKVTLSWVDPVTGAAGSASKTPSATSDEVQFTGLAIPAYAHVPTIVDVKVDVVSTLSITSNERVELNLSTDVGDFKATAASGTEDTTADSLSNPAQFVVKQTKPTITPSATTPSGTNFVPGNMEVLKFNVAADSNKAVVLNEMVFTISASDIDSSEWDNCTTGATGLNPADFSFYNVTTDPSKASALDVDADWLLLDATGDDCDEAADGDGADMGEDVAFAKLTLATPVVVPAGATYTFALNMNASGASAGSNDSLQVGIGGDPILESASFLAASNLNESDLAANDTVLTVASADGYTAGDIICIDTANDGCGASDEKALVVSVDTDAETLTVVRGYLGTTPDKTGANDANDDVDRLPSAFVWEDDGTTGANGTGEDWGAYLVSGLPLVGGAIGF